MGNSSRDEHGVALLEFALVVPTLLLLILGIVDYGDRYKTAAMYNNAAFSAARSMTIENSAAKAKAAAIGAGMPSSLTPAVSYTGGFTSCAQAGDGSFANVTVTITNSDKATVTQFFGATYTVVGRAVARCSGT